MATNERLPPRLSRLSMAMLVCGPSFPNPPEKVQLQPPPRVPIYTYIEVADPREEFMINEIKKALDII